VWKWLTSGSLPYCGENEGWGQTHLDPGQQKSGETKSYITMCCMQLHGMNQHSQLLLHLSRMGFGHSINYI
jgi:hypothetical protein